MFSMFECNRFCGGFYGRCKFECFEHSLFELKSHQPLKTTAPPSMVHTTECRSPSTLGVLGQITKHSHILEQMEKNRCERQELEDKIRDLKRKRDALPMFDKAKFEEQAVLVQRLAESLVQSASGGTGAVPDTPVVTSASSSTSTSSSSCAHRQRDDSVTELDLDLNLAHDQAIVRTTQEDATSTSTTTKSSLSSNMFGNVEFPSCDDEDNNLSLAAPPPNHAGTDSLVANEAESIMLPLLDEDSPTYHSEQPRYPVLLVTQLEAYQKDRLQSMCAAGLVDGPAEGGGGAVDNVLHKPFTTRGMVVCTPGAFRPNLKERKLRCWALYLHRDGSFNFVLPADQRKPEDASTQPWELPSDVYYESHIYDARARMLLHYIMYYNFGLAYIGQVFKSRVHELGMTLVPNVVTMTPGRSNLTSRSSIRVHPDTMVAFFSDMYTNLLHPNLFGPIIKERNREEYATRYTVTDPSSEHDGEKGGHVIGYAYKSHVDPRLANQSLHDDFCVYIDEQRCRSLASFCNHVAAADATFEICDSTVPYQHNDTIPRTERFASIRGTTITCKANLPTAMIFKCLVDEVLVSYDAHAENQALF